MATHSEEDLRYPVGHFQKPTGMYSADDRDALLKTIEEFPAKLTAAVEGLSQQQLDTPYRPGGWTVRQVVHHVVDSHINSYVRCKLALTEENPTIKPYDEKSWAELPDSKLPVELSLGLLDRLHQRWVAVLTSLPENAWSRNYVHPENGQMDLNTTLGLYAWHSRHHLAHITKLRERESW